MDTLDDVMDAWPAGEERSPLSLCKPQLQEHPRSSLSVVCSVVLDQLLWFLAQGGEKFELQSSQVSGERLWQEQFLNAVSQAVDVEDAQLSNYVLSKLHQQARNSQCLEALHGTHNTNTVTDTTNPRRTIRLSVTTVNRFWSFP